MSKWTVLLRFEQSTCFTDIESESRAEAIEKAFKMHKELFAGVVPYEVETEEQTDV